DRVRLAVRIDPTLEDKLAAVRRPARVSRVVADPPKPGAVRTDDPQGLAPAEARRTGALGDRPEGNQPPIGRPRGVEPGLLPEAGDRPLPGSVGIHDPQVPVARRRRSGERDLPAVGRNGRLIVVERALAQVAGAGSVDPDRTDLEVRVDGRRAGPAGGSGEHCREDGDSDARGEPRARLHAAPDDTPDM